MPNTNFASIGQTNFNFSDHDATSTAFANSGGNVTGGLLGINAGNPAIATSVAVNASPVTQLNTAGLAQINFDLDLFDIG